MKKWIKRLSLFILSLLLLIAIILQSIHVIKNIQVTRTLSDTDIESYQTVDSRFGEVAYRVKGEETNEALVLVHGFMGSSYDYRYLMDELKDDYYIIAIDLLGFGKSVKDSDIDFTKTNQAHAVYDVITALNLSDFTLAGHSMGGEVVMRYAALYQDTLSELILFASVSPLVETNNNVNLPVFFYEYVFKNYALQRFAFNSVYHQDAYKSSSYYDPMFYINKEIPAKTIKAFNQSSKETDLAELLPSITIPVTIIYGKEDTWTPRSNGEYLQENLSNSTLYLIDETGHLPFIEAVNDVIEILNQE
ncbi:MAG: alpha/beta fold hydrolase [Candidatus Izemoplasmataceae bacterium]